MMQVVERACAKINLSLDVTGKRENGYHEIDGVMQSVSLCDEVTVRVDVSDRTEVQLSAEGNPEMPTDGRNIAVKAALLFLEAANETARVKIDLQKRIPMAGGLAGGSTDAAAVLRALNRLFGDRFSMEALCTLGARLGADVPFCLVGGSVRTQGIGEVLTVLPPMPDCYVVVARRGEGVSTPWGYAKLDEIYGDFAPSIARPDAHLDCLLKALEAGELQGVCDHVYNIFELIVAECRPDVTMLCAMMRESGAMLARMSGSGPSVFGIFDREDAAKVACERLLQAGAEAFVCRPVRALSE